MKKGDDVMEGRNPFRSLRAVGYMNGHEACALLRLRLSGSAVDARSLPDSSLMPMVQPQKPRGRASSVSWTSASRPQTLFLVLMALSAVGVLFTTSQVGSFVQVNQDQTATSATTAAGKASRLHFRSAEEGALQTEANATTNANASLELSEAATGIPRIIHQSWKTTDKIPTRFFPWMRSWLQFNPTWAYTFWTDEDNLQLFERLYPKYLDVAKNVQMVALADMARYALLHSVGGLYIDADFECLKPFEELHRDNNLFLSTEPLAHSVLLEGATSSALCNALMASVPGHPFWLQVLDNIKVKFAEGLEIPCRSRVLAS